MSEVTIQTVAREAAGWFTTKQRGEEGIITVLKDEAPEWVTAIVYAGHGSGFLPDDWRYEKISEALEYIAEADDPEDSHEFADGAVDVYTGARYEWLSSNLQRSGYVEEARDEGLISEGADIADQIGVGQYQEASELYALVLEALGERVDDLALEAVDA